MDISFDTLLAVASLLLGGGGGAFFTWRWQRRKAKAEADSAEVEVEKERQEYYQRMVEDIASDRDYYKQERDEYRRTIKGYDERIDQLERAVARNGRMVEAMRPFMCADLSCKLRKRVVLSTDGEPEKGRRKAIKPVPPGIATADIEPLDMKDL